MKNFIKSISLALLITLVSCSGGQGSGTVAIDSDNNSNSNGNNSPTANPVISIASSTLNIYVGETNTITLSKSGVDICEATNLPSYATLNATNCVITLNPVTYSAMNVNFSIVGKNTIANPVLTSDPINFTLTLVVRPPVLTASTNSASLAVNTAMSNITIESTSALVECSNTIVIPGVSLNLSGGRCIISGTPTATGTYNYEVLARTNGSAFGEAIAISIVVYIPPTITATQANIDGKVGDSVSVNFNINSGVTVTTCNISPSLPAGLSLTRYSDRCALSGALPSETAVAGTNYLVSAVSSSGQTSNTISFNIKANRTFCDSTQNSHYHATTNNGSSASTPVIICTAQGLIDYASNSANDGKYYRLQKNINYNSGTNSAILTFNGHLDGAGYSVTFNPTGTASCQGFVAVMTGGSISNLHVRNVTTSSNNSRMGFVGCVSASGLTVNFNNILMTNNTSNNTDSMEFTGLFIGTINANTTVNINNMYSSIDHLENGDPMNFSLIYSSKSGSAVVNSTNNYFTNTNNVTGFDSTASAEVDHSAMMSNPAGTLVGFSASNWSLVAMSSPSLVLKQNKIYTDSIVQP